MIRSIAIALAKHWAANGVIGESDKETYQYGLELLISTFINLVIMIWISIAFGHPLIIVPYLLAFIPFRLFAGGYHARNHLFCILFNAISYFVSWFNCIACRRVHRNSCLRYRGQCLPCVGISFFASPREEQTADSRRKETKPDDFTRHRTSFHTALYSSLLHASVSKPMVHHALLRSDDGCSLAYHRENSGSL